MNKLGKPSPSAVIATVALVCALGGTAWALSNGSVKSKHIARDAVADKHLRESSTLRLKRFVPSASDPDFAVARANATRVRLFRGNGFGLYAKCFVDTSSAGNPLVSVGVYLEAPAGTVFASDEKTTSNGELGAGTPETQREIATQASAAGPGNPGTLNIPDADEMAFYAAAGNRFIEGNVVAATKVGNPTAGNGPFGPGSKCMTFGTVRSG